MTIGPDTPFGVASLTATERAWVALTLTLIAAILVVGAVTVAIVVLR